MQFHHAHAFRPQVGMALAREWPRRSTRGSPLGAEPITVDVPGMGLVPAGHRSRRDTFERALRTTADTVPGLTIRQGHVDGVLVVGGPGARDRRRRVGGRGRPGGGRLRAVRSQRRRAAGPAAGRRPVRHGLRRPPVPPARRRGARPDDQPARLAGPTSTATRCWCSCTSGATSRSSWSGRPPTPALKDLRHQAAFEAACRAIPGLAAWTDPDRAAPVTDVPPGWRAVQHLPRAARARRRPCIPGLVSVGDAVATTTPIFGRGVATTFMQALRLLAAARQRARPRARRGAVRRLVRGEHAAVGRRPRAHGRRRRPPVGGRRRRPDPAVAVGPDPRRRRAGPRASRRPTGGYVSMLDCRRAWTPWSRSPAPSTSPAGGRRSRPVPRAASCGRSSPRR